MKYKYFFATISCLLSLFALSQSSYRNDWIDYNKTYYKFSLGNFGDNTDGTPIKSGLVHVSQQTLAAAGLANVEAQNFQLWRNGQQVPVYTSSTIGIMAANDFIEFWGEANDGILDKDLYSNPNYQLSDYYSIQTDSAAYFFTYNNTGNNKRLQQTANNAKTATIQADANFMYTVGRYYRDRYNDGYNVLIGVDPIISSAYDRGEGWFSNAFTIAAPLSQNFTGLAADALGAAVSVRVNVVGTGYYTRCATVSLNNERIGRSKALVNYDYDKISITGISAGKLAGNTALITIKDSGAGSLDQMFTAKIEMDYPRRFDFGNASSFRFNLDASARGRLINITNFSAGTAAPVLYDLANGKRYTAEISVASTFSFLLLPSAVAYNLVLVRADGTTVTTITRITPRKFVDYSKVANQGNYLIISNPLIYGGSTNFVEQYRDYRSSADGGGYQAITVSVEDLVDQFAYGIKKHPLCIKNFLRYARNTFATKPAYALLIGKGVVYTAYRSSQLPDATTEQLNLVPTWGNPGSDNLLSSADSYNPIPLTPIGRISAVSGAEVGDYLAKVKHYEALQKTNTTGAIQDKAYMKKVIQIAGGNDVWINQSIADYTANYTRIITDTFFGAETHNFIQDSDPAEYAKAVVGFKDIYESGSGIVEYFGHASSTSLDFSLDDPEAYNTNGKYPMFIVNGCLAGNIFDLDANRLTQRSTISEKFVLEPEKGAIGYISGTSWGIVSLCDYLTQKLYESIAKTRYGQGFGDITADAINRALFPPGEDAKIDEYYTRYQAEGLAYHGDPAIRISPYQKPDYAVDTAQLTLQSAAVSVADDSYKVQVKMYNLGMAAKDSVHVKVYRKYANGDTSVVFSQQRAAVNGIDSFTVTFPIVPNRDTATQYVYAFIDDNNTIAEENESNNLAFIPITIYQSDIRPVFPYNYSIINSNTVTLSASTANPLANSKMYVLQMDTTALFNSPIKIIASANSSGGIVQFANIPLPLNAFYYWRVAEAGTNYWNQFSFKHDATATAGNGQSHFFQHTKSAFTNTNLDSARSYNFTNTVANLYIQQGVYPYSTQDGDFSVMLNGTYVAQSACVGSSIVFNIFDAATMKPIPNTSSPFGAVSGCKLLAKNNYEFSTQTAASRQNANLFLQSLPTGTFVVARRIYDMGNADFADVWRADSALYNTTTIENGLAISKANTLYQTFKSYGLPIDDYSYPRTFAFVYKTGDINGFKPVGTLSAGVSGKITMSLYMPSLDTSGYIVSPQFGPATAWNQVKWSGVSATPNSVKNVSVIGVNNAGIETVLYTLDTSQQVFNISGVNAALYPFVKLKLKTQDGFSSKPYQLASWSVGYQPAAEGALAPNLGISIPDNLDLHHNTNMQYDTLQGYVVFKNVSTANFKPIKIKASLTDANNNVYNFSVPNSRALPAGDTIHASFLLDVRSLPQGMYNLELEINPGNDQPEQYLFNNSLFKYVRISRIAITLPVQLLSFEATKKADHQALLSWLVAQEINLDRYEVQTSTNGQQFTTIASVKANAGKAYSYVHSNPEGVKNYYRLKMVDKDGAFSYSPVRWVSMAQTSITAGPNPFINNIKITTAGTAKHTVNVYSAAGQLVATKTFSGNTVVNAPGLAAGMYTVQVNDGATSKTFKLQKQH